MANTTASALSELQVQVKELQLQVQELEAHTNQTNSGGNIIKYGEEDLSFLTPELLHQRFLEQGDGVIKTIEDIHFHLSRPENHNVKLRSSKGMTAWYRGGESGRWHTIQLKSMADMLLERSFELITHRLSADMEYHDYIRGEHEDVFSWQMKFRNKHVKKPLMERAMALIVNNRLPYEDAMEENRRLAEAEKEMRMRRSL